MSVFQELSASINKISFWQGDWALGYHSIKFRQFPDISQFPKIVSLNPIQDGHFRGCSRMGVGGCKKVPLPKICHTNPAMIKLCTIILYLKKIQRYMNHVTHSLNSDDISIFSPEISKFCYIKKYRYRFHFKT